MGVKNTINGRIGQGSPEEQYTSLEEAKADIMGLSCAKLYEMGEITSGEVMNNYVTFFAEVFRSSRFGAKVLTESQYALPEILC